MEKITVNKVGYEVESILAVSGQSTVFRTKCGKLVKAYCPSFGFRSENGELVAKSEIWQEDLCEFKKRIVSAEERGRNFWNNSHQSQFCSWEYDSDLVTAVMREAPADCQTVKNILENWENMPPSREGEEYCDLERVRLSLSIIRSLLGAVNTLHKCNLLHLDLSPGNIIWAENAGGGTAYLLDMGSNREIGSPASSCTESSEGFASPEVRSGGNTLLGPSADLYSVAALFLVLACGKRASYRDFVVRDLPGRGKISIKDPVEKLDVPQEIKAGLVNIVYKATTRRGEYYGAPNQEKTNLTPAEEMLFDLRGLEEKCRPMAFPLQPRLPRMLDKERFQDRLKESRELLKYLNNGQKRVFICGDGGLGKTEFIISFATQHREYNWHYTTFQGDIRKTVLGLKFHGFSTERIMPSGKREIKTEEEQYEEKLKLLSKYDSHSVLIIDNYDGDMKLLEDEELGRLNEMDIRIVYTTRNDFQGKSRVQICPLETEQLLKLMKWYLEGRAYAEDDLRALIEQVQRNTLIVDIIARLMSKSIRHIKADELLPKLKNSTWEDEILNKEVQSDYQQKTVSRTALGHLQTLFNVAGLNGDASYVMSCACMIPEGGVDVELFLECMDDADEVVENLRDTGWLKHDKASGLIRIHPLIRTVCLNSATAKPSYPAIKPFWEKLLSCKKDQTRWEQIGEILQNLLSWVKEKVPQKLWFRTEHTLMDVDYNCCRYMAAKERGEKLYEFVSENIPTDHDSCEIAADICKTLGIICHQLSMHRAAKNYLSEALTFQEMLPYDPEKIAALYIRLGRVKVALGSDTYLSRATEDFEKGLELLPGNSVVRADCLDGQAELYEIQGDLTKAQELYLQAMRIRKELLPQDSYDFAYSHDNLGRLLVKRGEHPEAIQHFAEAVRILKIHSVHTDLNLCAGLIHLGSCWFAMKEYRNALDCYLETVRIYEASLPENHPLLVKAMFYVGVYYAKLGEYERSLKYFCDAAGLGAENYELKDCFDRDYISVNYFNKTLVKNIIECLYEMRDSWCGELLELDGRIVNLCYLIGICYEYFWKWDECVENFSRALDFGKSICSTEDALMFDLNLRLGRAYYRCTCEKRPVYLYRNDEERNKNLALSLKCFREADIYRKKMNWSITLRIATYYQEYGQCYQRTGNWREATRVFQDILTALDPHDASKRIWLQYIMIRANLVQCYAKQAMWRQCVDAFHKIQSETGMDGDFINIAVEQNIDLYVGLAYKGLGDSEKALEYLLKSEQNMQTAMARFYDAASDAEREQMYRALSEVYSSLGDTERQQHYTALAAGVSD